MLSIVGKLKTVFGFLLLLIFISLSASAALQGGSWQWPGATTGQVNGTEPVADSAWIPVYQAARTC